MRQFFLQMAGHSGTGKTTLARAIAERTGAVRLDKDEIMASLMHAGVEPTQTGGIAYEVGFDLGRSLLAAGHSVIFDSAAYFVGIRNKGQAIAEDVGVKYFIIHTHVPELALAEARVSSRVTLHELQPTTLAVVDVDYQRPGTAPLFEPHLELDTSRPLELCVEEALEYIGA